MAASVMHTRLRATLRRLREHTAYAIAQRMARLHPQMHIIVVRPPYGVPLPQQTITACVTAGLRHTSRMLVLEAQRVARDRLLAQVNPEFFGHEDTED